MENGPCNFSFSFKSKNSFYLFRDAFKKRVIFSDIVQKGGPPLFFDCTWNYAPQLFLGAPWAEKMTFFKKPDMSDLDGIRPLFILGREVGIHAGSFLAN